MTLETVAHIPPVVAHGHRVAHGSERKFPVIQLTGKFNHSFGGPLDNLDVIAIEKGATRFAGQDRRLCL